MLVLEVVVEQEDSELLLELLQGEEQALNQTLHYTLEHIQ